MNLLTQILFVGSGPLYGPAATPDYSAATPTPGQAPPPLYQSPPEVREKCEAYLVNIVMFCRWRDQTLPSLSCLALVRTSQTSGCPR